MVQKIKVMFWVVFIGMVTSPALAGYNISSRGNATGPLASITAFFQQLVNLVDGPLLVGLTVIALIAAILMWNWNPQGSKALGIAVRACLSCIVGFQLTALITWLSGL